MDIRQFTLSDIDACSEAFVEIFNDEPWHDEWTREGAKTYVLDFFNTPKFLGFIAEDNQDIIGFIFGVQREWWSGREFYIHEMGVKKAYRNQGVGKSLLKTLENALKSNAVQYVSLLTDRNTPTETFYKTNDFQEITRLVF